MKRPAAGYREIEHTADWELHVWAPDLAALLEQAAQGMYALSDTRLQDRPRLERTLEIEASDPEALLVTFLSELLFFGENERIGFDRYHLQLDQYHLQAKIYGAKIVHQSKEIKAVTYHRIAVKPTAQGLEVNIVFDV